MKKVVLLIITGVLIVFSVILIVMGFNLDYTVKETDDNGEFNLIGKWYVVRDMGNYEYEFFEDGTYKVIDMYDNSKDSEGKYVLDNVDGKFTLSEKHEYRDNVEYKDYDYVMIDADSKMFKIHYYDDEYYLFYKNKDERRPYDEACLNPDKDGYCIENGVLIAYIGNDNEITIPSNVHTIGSNAFAGDFNRGLNTNKVTIPGTVKEIKGSAFAYTYVNEVFIKEGVETLGGNLFMDTCISLIHFPKSIKAAGGGMFNPEEKCGSIDIHLYKGSYMDDYIKEDEPYYDEVNVKYK